ncbi:unnamed protein product [Caenorhabditis auriculariae]|uniref:Potassium channel domain-containing protein n=1 Tax=Caenorhabditis auriculariae TaxID=2777116 RepID=A0A8S1GVR3_9PELO|nr:unnamed protein product [Caenorhabditis auriculariae]
MMFRRVSLSLRDKRMFWNLVAVNYEKYHLHHFMLFVFLLCYSLFGAFVFVLLEAEHERSSNDETSMKLVRQSVAAKNFFVERVQSMYFQRSNQSDFYEAQLRKALVDYDQAMGISRRSEVLPKWDIWGGLYYAGTIFTTIGYGDLAAVTIGGRIFTMLYAVIGIPMVITILNDWGTMLFHTVNSFWQNYALQWINLISRKLKEKSRPSEEEGICSKNEDLPSKSARTDGQHPMPLFLVVVVLFSWVSLCTVVFSFLENWTFFESVYFFFISMTTIGFGDLTPGHRVAVANFLLILIGLSVVSMSINVVQMQLEVLFARIVKRIESDFKNNLSSGADDRKRSIGVTAVCDVEKSKKKGMEKEGDVTDKYADALGGTEKLLMRFMSHHQKKMLNDKFEERAKMRNKYTQTTNKIKVASVQTADKFEPLWTEEEENDEPNTSKSRINTRRLYIYNTGE